MSEKDEKRAYENGYENGAAAEHERLNEILKNNLNAINPAIEQATKAMKLAVSLCGTLQVNPTGVLDDGDYENIKQAKDDLTAAIAAMENKEEK
jgi:hypothetical protein